MEQSTPPDETTTSSQAPTGKPPVADAAHAIFVNALELPERERNAFVRQACAGDAELDALVRELLAADAEIEFEEVFTAKMESRDLSGTMIGRYRVLSLLGEGGFGYVYSAEQREPVERTVALKIIKLGMDTRQVIARFEAERQALALMDHPNIARVFDGGSTETGRPYFVMELVKGLPITEYCDSSKLTIEERLGLFAMVCDAVQHAHQKGVIHRDIKPSNVLVTVRESGPVPKVIDFGVAKAINARLTDKTLYTELSQMIGTPEYMSPEQAGTNALDIDTRSDVYSLGVLLYELLIGATPFAEVRTAGYAEIQRIIREVDPTRPSTRLSTLDGVGKVAASRRLDPRRLETRLHGDLDWIVLKALEKDRTRRYETASALATDIRRHLRDEPVEAGPPSTAYRVRKFVRRNRGQVAAAGIIAATLVVASIVSIAFGLAAERARVEESKRAEELDRVARFQASQLRDIDVALMAARLREDLLAEVRTAMERSNLDDSEVADRMEHLDELVAGANLTNVALSVLDRNILARALIETDEQFADPELELVRARLLQTLAETLRDLGLLEEAMAPQTKALEIRRRVLGEDHTETLISVSQLGTLLRNMGRLDEATPYYQEALEGFRRAHGDEHRETLSAISGMGALLRQQGKREEAKIYFMEALEGRRRVLGEEDPETLTSMSNMGSLLVDQGKLDDAEPFFRKALAGFRRIHGNDDQDTLRLISNLGTVLKKQQRFEEAEAFFREALEGCRRVYGDRHPDTLSALNSMGTLLEAQRKLDEAEPYFLEALDGFRRLYGDLHENTLIAINNMGMLLRRQGKLDEAEPFCHDALDGFRRVRGPEHPYTLIMISNMGTLRQSQGKFEEAERYFRQALEGKMQRYGPEHASTLITVRSLGAVLNETKRYVEAEELLRAHLPAHESELGDDDPRTARARSILGAALVGLQEYEEAETQLVGAHAILDATLPSERRAEELGQSIERLVALYVAWGKPDLAEEWRAKLDEFDAEAPASGASR